MDTTLAGLLLLAIMFSWIPILSIGKAVAWSKEANNTRYSLPVSIEAEEETGQKEADSIKNEVR